MYGPKLLWAEIVMGRNWHGPILLWAEMTRNHVKTGLPGLNQYLARINVPCSRTQRSDTSEAQTRSPLVFSQALYHWATALPHSAASCASPVKTSVANSVDPDQTVCLPARISHWHKHLHAADDFSMQHMSCDMRFQTMWYVRPAKPQISLRICAGWSEPFLVAWIFYEC